MDLIAAVRQPEVLAECLASITNPLLATEAQLHLTGHKRHSLQPSLRESSDSLRQQAASTNLPMPSTPASGNGVYALALGDTPRLSGP